MAADPGPSSLGVAWLEPTTGEFSVAEWDGPARFDRLRDEIGATRPREILARREADLPAWCHLTANELVSWTKQGRVRSFLVAKGSLAERRSASPRTPTAVAGLEIVPVRPPGALPQPAPAPAVEPLSVMGVGSWPRPRWVVHALHERLEGRMSEADFDAT